jgi:hypothetical protein
MERPFFCGSTSSAAAKTFRWNDSGGLGQVAGNAVNQSVDDSMLLCVNHRGPLVAEINLKPDSARVFDHRPDRCVENLVVQANLDAVADLLGLRLLRLGMRLCKSQVPRIVLFDSYCLSYTCTALAGLPSAVLPLVVTVTVFPSTERSTEALPISFPSFFVTPVIL